MTGVVGVPGTWGSKGGWWSDGSDFWQHVASLGLEPVRIEGKPFEWSTELGTSLCFWRQWGIGSGSVKTWQYAGKALGYYLSDLPPSERAVIAHSHGGQLAFYAAADGWLIDRLMTVGTPVRADMEAVVAQARPNIRQWWHVCDMEDDRIARWGAFGDGRWFRVTRTFPQAGINFRAANIGHSGLLEDPSVFHYWKDLGLAEFLKGTH